MTSLSEEITIADLDAKTQPGCTVEIKCNLSINIADVSGKIHLIVTIPPGMHEKILGALATSISSPSKNNADDNKTSDTFCTFIESYINRLKQFVDSPIALGQLYEHRTTVDTEFKETGDEMFYVKKLTYMLILKYVASTFLHIITAEEFPSSYEPVMDNNGTETISINIHVADMSMDNFLFHTNSEGKTCCRYVDDRLNDLF